MSPPCPLCVGPSAPFAERDRRAYLRCAACDLVFVPPEYLPDKEREQARYLQHRNDPGEAGYRNFLARFQRCLTLCLRGGEEGLDYGCGPSPVLAGLFQEDGFSVQVYDPFFHPRREALARTYDFIACTETAEHFHRPHQEFAALDRLLRPRGWLGVMTQMLEDWAEFPRWSYPRDFTHVCFYSRNTMRWLADTFRWECRFPLQDVVLFRKC